MKGDVNVPEPTAEEKALQGEQTALLRQQREILLSTQKSQASLMPIFAKQMGLTLKYDKKGQIIGASEAPKTAAEKAKAAQEGRITGLQGSLLEKTLNQMLHPEKDPLYAKQQKLLNLQLTQLTDQLEGPQAKQDALIKKLLGERTLKALRGELEIDPALERNIKEGRETLKERLRSQFGSGYDTSSPGIEALSKFEESSNILRDQSRKGELTLSEQLGNARAGVDLAQGGLGMSAATAKLPGIDPLSAGGFAFGMGQNAFGQKIQTQQQLQQIISSPLGIAGGLGQVASGFQMPIGQMQNDRQMQLDASIQNSRNDMMGMGALGSVFGSVIGMLPFSDARLKDDLIQIGEWKTIPIYAYTMDDERKIGVLAQDLIGISEMAVAEFNGWLHVNYGSLA